MIGLFKKKKKPLTIFGEIEPYLPDNKMAKQYKDYDKDLLEKYGKCRKFNKEIKILCFADTHGKIMYNQNEYKLSEIDNDYDVCLLLGDISCDDIREILKYVDKNKIYGILGNHDYFSNLEKFDILNINGKVIDINGVRISGIEGAIKYKEEQPGYTIEDGFEFVKSIPEADICITHAPPFGAVGLENNSLHIGAPYINEYLFRTKCPIVLSGHNHVDRTHEYLNGTKGISLYKQKTIVIKNNTINIL